MAPDDLHDAPRINHCRRRPLAKLWTWTLSQFPLRGTPHAEDAACPASRTL